MESIDETLHSILKEAFDSGISETEKRRLYKMLKTHKDVCRIKLGPDLPPRVAPLRILLVPTSGRIAVLSVDMPLSACFHREHNKRPRSSSSGVLETHSEMGEPCSGRPKARKHEDAFHSDLRDSDVRTVPVQPSMPHPWRLLQSTQGSICFAQMDT